MKKLFIQYILFLFFTPFLSFAQPKKVILMIGDGMGLSHAYAAYTVNKGSLNIFTMPITGLSKTFCADRYITDSGAGATALAIGHKANYESIGLDSLWQKHPSLIKLSKQKGLSTAIITTSNITHATPAAFVANVRNRNMQDEIALSFLEGNVDVFIGGGKDNFVSNKRKDKLSLIDSLRARDYNLLYNIDEVDNFEINKNKKNLIAGLLYDNHPPLAQKRNNMLCRSLEKTLSVLSENENGFFIMLEGSQIDFESHLHRFDNMVDEVLDFDKTVGIALEFAKKDSNTLVIVIADHETGGLTINGGSIKEGKVKDKWTSLEHTGVMVPIYAFGLGAEKFSGVMDNTDVFRKIKEFLEL